MANQSLRVDKSLSFRTLASPPSSPRVGEIYFDGTNLLTWNGSTWVALGSGGGGGGGTSSQVVYVKDYKTSGTNGGTASSATWLTRDLNTLENSASVSWVSLASNQITLSAGTYRVKVDTIVTSQSGNDSTHMVRLYNTTDTATILSGSSETVDIATGSAAGARSMIDGTFSISASKVLEVQSYIDNAAGQTDDFGRAVTSGEQELYTTVAIERLDTQYDLTVTGTNWTTTRAIGVPYLVATSAGGWAWRFKFNIVGMFSPGTANASVAITGVTFKGTTNYYQAITAWDVSTAASTQQARADFGANTLTGVRTSSSTDWIFSGDVELDGEPTL